MFFPVRKILFWFLLCSGTCFAVDRNAFTFTKYDLEIRVSPDEQAVAARGKVTLRNESDQSQKNIVLQISSSLEWRMIELNGQKLEYVADDYNSDIDHTGKLTEAVVTLPQPVAPKGTIELDLGYSGTIPRDASRLTAVKVPEASALASDWDRVGQEFTAVRGVGHVIWYPIATEGARFEGPLFPTIAQWQGRQRETTMKTRFCWITEEDRSYSVVANGTFEGIGGGVEGGEGNRTGCTSFSFSNLNETVPTFAIAPFEMLTRPAISLHFLKGHDSQASDYALAAEKVQPLIEEWFGKTKQKIQVIELPETGDAPFDSGAVLFTPLDLRDKKRVETEMAHQLTHAAFISPRQWISEGLAQFSELLVRETHEGRQAALDFADDSLPALVAAEKDAATAGNGSNGALTSTTDEIYYRVKAMYVWSMLRDMIGDDALKAVLKNYRPVDDKEPSYLQRLIAAQSKHDLEWFFDDWVYRDRGLPQLKIETAIPRQTLNNSYVVAITVENTGGAGAEIPVTVQSESGQQTLRLLVPAHQKATTRLSVPGKPKEVIVNDGSVPESDNTGDRMQLK
jgi:hypothetical protein